MSEKKEENVEEKEEEKIDVEGRKINNALTLRKAIDNNIPPDVFFHNEELSGLSKKLTWDLILRICNAMIGEGNPITFDSTIGETLNIFGISYKNAFFGKGSLT